MADNITYASYEAYPCVFTNREAWVLFDPDKGWTKIPRSEAGMAGVLSKDKFDKYYPHVPPLPTPSQ